jgi:hypothetical protein
MEQMLQMIQQQQQTINALTERMNALLQNQTSRTSCTTVNTDCDLSFKQCLDLIPHYSGNPSELLPFIDCITRLNDTYCRENESRQWSLAHCMLSKLHGPAYQAVLQRRCKTASSILETLRNNFADNRSALQLISELMNMTYKKSQHPLDFLNKLESKIVVIKSRYELDGVTGDLLEKLGENIDKQAFKILTFQLPRAVGLFLLNQHVETLEDARKCLTNNAELVLHDLGFSTDPNEAQHRRYESHTNPNKHQHKPQPKNEHNNHNKHHSQNSGQWKNKFHHENNPTKIEPNAPDKNWKPTVKEDHSMRTVSNFQKHHNHMVEESQNCSKFADQLDTLNSKLDHFLGITSIKEEPPTN